jgi:hypothetical protein
VNAAADVRQVAPEALVDTTAHEQTAGTGQQGLGRCPGTGRAHAWQRQQQQQEGEAASEAAAAGGTVGYASAALRTGALLLNLCAPTTGLFGHHNLHHHPLYRVPHPSQQMLTVKHPPAYQLVACVVDVWQLLLSRVIKPQQRCTKNRPTAC